MYKLSKSPVQLACLWLLVFLTACNVATTQTKTPEATVTLPAATSKAPFSQNSFQTTSDQLPPEPRLGQMQLHYPILMPPGASKTIDFSIYIPPELADASPEAFRREVLPPESPRPLGKYTEYNALILVAKQMQVELLAPNFAIQELYPAEQEVNLITPNTRTNWGWTISAPTQPNEYVLVVKVYIAGESVPRWVGSFDVLVEATLPTPPPLSTTDLILKNISDNAAALIGALLTTIVALIGLYLQYRKPKQTKNNPKTKR